MCVGMWVCVSSYVVSHAGLQATIYIGVFVILLACLGLVAASRRHMKTLKVYAGIMTLLLVVEVGVLVSVMYWLSGVDEAKEANAALVPARYRPVRNFINCAYNDCCNVTKAELKASCEPELAINPSVCLGLEAAEIVDDLRCVEGPESFRDEVIEWIVSNMNGFVVGASVLTAVQLVVAILCLVEIRARQMLERIVAKSPQENRPLREELAIGLAYGSTA